MQECTTSQSSKSVFDGPDLKKTYREETTKSRPLIAEMEGRDGALQVPRILFLLVLLVPLSQRPLGKNLAIYTSADAEKSCIYTNSEYNLAPLLAPRTTHSGVER